MNASLFDPTANYLRGVQDEITSALDEIETNGEVFTPDHGEFSTHAPARFVEENWHHSEAGGSITGGGGRSRGLENGRVIERGGVNFSDVSGEFSEAMAASMPGDSRAFRASGISLIIHPRNPMAPTVHANFRVIQRGPADAPERIWFGGGADLTPYYLQEEDARHFHETWRTVCNAHSKVADYGRMKKACDEYFYLPHRKEARGIGGIFYDHMEDNPEDVAEFSRAAASSFLDSYLPILRKRMSMEYGPHERDFQLMRRGRYVEFNLIHDRGTQFGLRTGGRTRSILMSLPPLAGWRLEEEPGEGTREAELIKVLRNPVDWI